jgi:hypothetical protein
MKRLISLILLAALPAAWRAEAQIETINSTDLVSSGPGKLNNNFTWLQTTKTGVPATYSGSATYNQGDAVISGAFVYVSAAGSNIGNTPASSPSWWTPVALAPITLGTTSQYVRGDLSLATFPTAWAWSALTGVPSTLVYNPMSAAGDLIVGGSSGAPTRLASPGNGTFCPSWSGGTVTWITCPGAGGGISSVGLTMPSGFSVSNSPLTTNGTIAVSLATESASNLLIAPTAGGTPTFRALTAQDVPTLNQSTTGNAATATNATEVGGITVSGTPSSGQVLTATSATAANWQASSGGGNASITPTPLGNVSGSVTLTRSTNIQEWTMTLTGSVTFNSTITGAANGDVYYFAVCQNSAGGYSVSWPNGFPPIAVDANASMCTYFGGTWTGSVFDLSGPPTSNETQFLLSGAAERTAPTSAPPSGSAELWPDIGRHTWASMDNASSNKHIMPRTAGTTDQLASTDLSDYSTMNAATATALAAAPSICSAGSAPQGVDVHGNALDCTSISGGGGMVYPGAGVPNSSGSAWNTSYTVGTAANDLIQLNSSAQLPAVSGANLTNLPAATSLALSSTPTQCSGGQVPTGITTTGAADGCFTPGGGGSTAFSALTSATNTSAAMVVGTGASIAASGSGTVAATSVGGIAVSGTPSSGQVLTATSSTAADWQTPSGGGSPAFSAITTGTNTTATMTVGSGASLAPSGTGSVTATGVSSGSSNPGTCTVGQLFVNTATPALEVCTAANTWTAAGGGSSAVTENTWVPFTGQYSTTNSYTGGPGVIQAAGNNSATVPDFGRSGFLYGFPYEAFNDDSTGGPETIFITWMLHQNWTGTLNVMLVGASGSTSGNAYMLVSTLCVPNGNNIEVSSTSSYNTSSTGTLTMAGTAGALSYLTLSNVNVSGCSAGNVMVVRVQRDHTNSADTLSALADVIGMQLQWQHT